MARYYLSGRVFHLFSPVISPSPTPLSDFTRAARCAVTATLQEDIRKSLRLFFYALAVGGMTLVAPGVQAAEKPPAKPKSHAAEKPATAATTPPVDKPVAAPSAPLAEKSAATPTAPAEVKPDKPAETVTGFVPGTGSRTDVRPYYFAIPAPRGQILDRKGRPLAQNALVHRLLLTVPADQRTTLQTFTAWLEQEIATYQTEVPSAHLPDAETLQRHYDSRREMPIAVSDAQSHEITLDAQKHPHASVRTEYVRHYAHGNMAAHLLGYVSADGAAPGGPVLRSEPLWQRTRGAAGLEAALNKQLTGTDGTLCLMIADAGTVAYQQVFTPPQAGRDVVTTLNLDTQRLAESALDHSGHRCAMVIVDANTGDIRAMASNPRFDPNSFAGGISSADFTKLTEDINGPLFDRAVQGSYPPGSVFKPIVVLAGLRAGTVDAQREFECGPSLMIDGREFDNWSKDDHGWFNARAALIRSCNTYFYQSAMTTRDRPILYMAHEFGFGTAPTFPVKTSAGNLPPNAPSNHDLANLSIGQGVTEASPLQVAMAMATLANGACRPRARLVMQTQSQSGQLGDLSMPCREALMPVSGMDLETVRHGMFGVVNHVNGTGKAARLKKIPVYGKTGTAQWVLRGAKANVVWFAGYVGTNPPLAFAVMVEGNAGEGGLSGGGTAAPVIAKVLRDIEAKPSVHGVTYENGTVTEENDPLAVPMTEQYLYGSQQPGGYNMYGGPPPQYYGEPPPRYGSPPPQRRQQYPDNSVGGFFQRLFR